VNATWPQFVAALRATEDSDTFARLIGDIGGAPAFEETPGEENNPEGRTRYFKFPHNGIEIGFRKSRLNHIHFFVRPRESYNAYSGPLDESVGRDQDEQRITEALGAPDISGGAKQSALLGFVPRWVKYQRADHAVRYEFAPGGEIAKVTLIAQ
jgi:filamentous hemagglutinin